MVGRDRRRHARLDGGEVIRRQGPRQFEVVVEAIGDGRTDAQLRAREEVHDRLGHDVRGGVPHGVERVARARVEQLLDRPSLGRDEDLLVRRGLPLRFCHRPTSRNRNSLSSIDRTRGCASRGPTRLRRRTRRRRSRGRANGRRPGRFTGRSRVVATSRRSVGASSLGPDSLVDRLTADRRVPLGALLRDGGRHWTRTSDLLHVKQVL